MSKFILKLPEENFSPIDFYLEKIENPEKIRDVILTKLAYEKGKKNQQIEQDSFLPFLFDYHGTSWKRDETIIEGKHYASLFYVLEHNSDNEIHVRQIEYGEDQNYVYPNLKANTTIIIDG